MIMNTNKQNRMQQTHGNVYKYEILKKKKAKTTQISYIECCARRACRQQEISKRTHRHDIMTFKIKLFRYNCKLSSLVIADFWWFRIDRGLRGQLFPNSFIFLAAHWWIAICFMHLQVLRACAQKQPWPHWIVSKYCYKRTLAIISITVCSAVCAISLSKNPSWHCTKAMVPKWYESFPMRPHNLLRSKYTKR